MAEVRVAIAPARGERGIPMDVANTLMEVIGLAYPNAKMGQEPGAAFVLIVDDEDRAPRTKVGTRAAAKAFRPREVPEDDETLLLGFDGQNLRVAPPEVLTRHMAEVAALTLKAVDGASNYVEQKATHPELGDFVVIMARSKGQTPHELRQKAVDERDELAHQIEVITDHAAKHGGVTASALRRLLNEG